jgi:hypothetical protein
MVFVGEYVPDPLPKIIRKTLELFALAKGAKPIHHRVATTVDAVRV